MDIHLHQDSIVNERTGVVEQPSEYVENLRSLERSVTRYDSDIEGMRAELKVAKECREKAVAKLREAIREGKVLPLLESDDADAEATNGAD